MSASYNSTVTVTIEAAFGDTVFDTTPTWTEITSSVRAFSTSRGRSRILDQTEAGTATLTLSNSAGAYSPWNTAGANYPFDLLTQIRIRATYNAVTYDLFRGYAVSWPATWPLTGKDAVVQVQCIDGFRVLAMVEEELTEDQELSGTRVGNLLDTAGWPAGWRDLNTGTHTVQALAGEFNTALGEIRRAALVEQGLFFIAGDGDATFLDGVHRIEDDSIQATFSDDGAGILYADLMVAYDDSQLWNEATVTRADGEPQTSTDSTSITTYGSRALHLSETLHYADGEAQALADWLVSEYKDVRARVPQITLIPERDAATLWPVALGLELWDKVNVERTLLTGDDFDEDCYIEGVSHDVMMVGGRRWHTTFQLSPDLQHTDWWILGTSALGTDTRLGY